MTKQPSRGDRSTRHRRLEHWERRRHEQRARRHRYRVKTLQGVLFVGFAIACFAIGHSPARFLTMFGAEPLATPTAVLTFGMTLFTVLFGLAGASLLWRALDIRPRVASPKERTPMVDAWTVHSSEHDFSRGDGDHEIDTDEATRPIKPTKDNEGARRSRRVPTRGAASVEFDDSFVAESDTRTND